MDILSRQAIAVLTVCFVGCAWGPTVFDCDQAFAVRAMDAAVAQWPDVGDVVDRLDVFCLPRGDVQSYSYCGRAKANDVDACLMWIGSDLGRARIYIADDAPVGAALLHELQHAHLWDDGGCPTHEESCGWEDYD